MASFGSESETESPLLHLPNEIVEMILLTDVLTHDDLGRMARVCSLWRDVCCSNELWKQKLRKRFHNLKQVFDFQKAKIYLT